MKCEFCNIKNRLHSHSILPVSLHEWHHRWTEIYVLLLLQQQKAFLYFLWLRKILEYNYPKKYPSSTKCCRAIKACSTHLETFSWQLESVGPVNIVWETFQSTSVKKSTRLSPFLSLLVTIGCFTLLRKYTLKQTLGSFVYSCEKCSLKKKSKAITQKWMEIMRK